MKLAAVSLACSLALAGCHLYFDDDDPPICDFQGDIAIDGQINPETGQCEYFGGWPCDPECGPCPGDAETQALPSWAFCNTHCTGLQENACLETEGCRGLYEGDGNLFEACVGTDQTGPVQGGDCTTYDAYECSRHDDCIAVHVSCTVDADFEAPEPCSLGPFLRCAPEPGNGDPGTCYGEVACDSEPPECPPETMPGIVDGCWSGFCIPIEDCEAAPACGDIGAEATCIARSDCSPRYRGVDCSCDDTSCTCADWLFESCSES